jgi:hypothetical protein
MFEGIGLYGSAAAGLAAGWLASHCARLPSSGFRMALRWVLVLGFPYGVLATVLVGAPAGIAAVFGTLAGAITHCCFIRELARRYNGGVAT